MLVLGAAIAWTGLLMGGMPYALYWWGALVATCCALIARLHPRHARALPAPLAVAPAWLVPAIAVAAVAVVLFSNRPAADDAFYQSIPATVLRFPSQPVLLHDTMYRLLDAPLLLPFYRLSNYNLLPAVVARVSGIDHLMAAHLLLPALAAIFGVLAWTYLLRRIAPSRWPWVLPILFACVMGLGEVHRAYGNFAFVHLHHGKAVLATCMVPVIAGAALDYMRHGGLRHWLLLGAAQVAALGLAASGLFVAPAAAALALAGGWTPDAQRSRRFMAGMLPVLYLAGVAWLAGSGTAGARALALPSPEPMLVVPDLLAQTWGPWSTAVLLVALLSAWSLARDQAGSRYLAAGAFFLLLVALNPYTTPFVAAHSIGVKTYWRLTWALPLPFFLAVILDALLARARAARPAAWATLACLAVIAPALAFATRFGVLGPANPTTLALPGLKVPLAEFALARALAGIVPEQRAVLAPETVATWIPTHVVHPRIVAVRHMYLSLAFDPRETAWRSNLMRYVAGEHRPADSAAWFARSVRAFRISGVAFAAAAPWAGEIETVLHRDGWQRQACDAYVLMWQELPTPGGHGREASRARVASAACRTPMTSARR
jgi:hypothetical protein